MSIATILAGFGGPSSFAIPCIAATASMPDTGVESLEMPFGNIIAYDIDPEGHMLAKDDTHIDSAAPNA